MTRFETQVAKCRTLLKKAGNFDAAEVAVISHMPTYAREVFRQALHLEGCEVLLVHKTDEQPCVYFRLIKPTRKRGFSLPAVLSLMDDAAQYCLDLAENKTETLWQLISTKLQNHIKGGSTIPFVEKVEGCVTGKDGYDVVFTGGTMQPITSKCSQGRLLFIARIIGII